MLNPTKDVLTMYSFSMQDWTTSKWSNTSHSVSPSNFTSKGFSKYIERSALEKSNYLKDDTLRIKCTIFVIPNGDKPAGNPTGANIIIANGFHTASYAPPDAPSNTYTKLPRQPTVRIYSEANRDLSVTVRNGTVVLAPADSNDHYQHWIKDMSYSNEVRDIHGLPAFALVNRVTGEALKNPIGENQQVSLVPYKPNSLKDPVKWTESLSTGFRTIRITDTPTLNMTALTTSDGDTIPDDGTKIVVKSLAGTPTPIQHWKIVPYNSNVPI
ncbi:MATH domain-containing protein [Carex littledalei]|uniref:MATH domain-containing protein n=1 Tax=Carex littledalei TaxID=544730 RepID=A0A833W246_9POAL|nr:MATH domain-containing protein [Carex littledalei]